MIINHARCLLLNVDGAKHAAQPEVPFDELVDPGFKAIAVPTALLAVRQIFYGASPDIWMLSWRTTQLLQIMEGGDAAEYVTTFDSRKTYDLRAYALDRTIFEPDVVPGPRSIASLTVDGVPAAPDASGVMSKKYHVATDGSFIYVTDLSTSFAKTFSGLSAALGDSGYSVRLSGLNAGDLWTVEILLEPKTSLGDLAATAKTLPDTVMIPIFGLNAPEPYKTFQNLWNEHPDFPMQLSGLILALVWRSEEVRLGTQK